MTFRTLCLAVLLAFFPISGVAFAAPITVTITGQYPLDMLGTAPPFVAPDFTLSFVTDTNPPIANFQTGAFDINITATFTSGTLSRTLDGTAGWFQYTPVGRGLDVRIYHFDGDGWLQTIFESGWTNPGVDLFTGTVDAPTILVEALHSASQSQAAYYPTADTHVFVDIPSADYSVGFIPEPATAILLCMPLAAIFAVALFRKLEQYGQSGNLR